MMAREERIIYVYDDFSYDEPVLLYDVNPVPYGDELSLLVDSEDNSIDIDLAISTAPRFGIAEKDAAKFSEEILTIVRDNWEHLAKEYGLSRSQIENMRPAFRECCNSN